MCVCVCGGGGGGGGVGGLQCRGVVLDTCTLYCCYIMYILKRFL